MTGKDIYKVWAPVGAKWVDWVRPVPFVAIDNCTEVHEVCDLTIPKINYINKLIEDTAIIVDIASYESIRDGLALAKIGYRPIPLYNGTTEQNGAMPIINNHAIEIALTWGAMELEKIKIENSAPPAFLLDSNRTHRYRMDTSIFDNSWDIYDQDVPTAEYFLKNGINKIIVRGEVVQRYLCRILYKFQMKGIKILFTDGFEEPKEIKIKKPPRKPND